MSLPIVIAHHLIWTMYGWWLPNDPRGSCSRLIRRDYLKDLGCLHYGRSGWKVFLDHPDEIRRTIGYIERNPFPYRLPIQRYDFVTPYDDWPLHDGHSMNSPYATRLRAAGRFPHDWSGR